MPSYHTACPTYNLLLSYTVISYVYRSFIRNKTTFTNYCLTQWTSKVSGNHWVGQYMVNSTGLMGIVNTTFYKPNPIFIGPEYTKLYWTSTLWSLYYSCQKFYSFSFDVECVLFTQTGIEKYHSWPWLSSTLVIRIGMILILLSFVPYPAT